MKSPFGLPDETRLCQVHLRTREMGPMAGFYSGALGLKLLSQSGSLTTLGAPGSAAPLLVLSEDRKALQPLRRATGLYHIAIRFPSHWDLAHALRRLTDRHYPLEGASDHLFSESIYLSDPDGNGVEIYVDRPSAQWPRKNGLLAGTSAPLDVSSLLALGSPGEPPREAPSGMDVGHIHLHVASLPEAERFYHDFIGFDVTIRDMPGALFFSAGGYHHHIGVNTWAGSAASPPNSVGLVSYRFSVPMTEVLHCLHQRAPFAGFEAQRIQSESGLEVLQIRDPNGTWAEFSLDPTGSAGVIKSG